MVTDDSAHVVVFKGEAYIRSKELADSIAESAGTSTMIAFFFEGTQDEARCVVQEWDQQFIDALQRDDDTLRLDLYDVPPTRTSLLDTKRVLRPLYRKAAMEDEELFAPRASIFLDAPHIVTAILERATSLPSEENLNFTITIKKIAEQLRTLVRDHGRSVAIRKIERSHLQLWAEMQGRRIAFLDGGVARIPGLSKLEPLALRVGVYEVTPGAKEFSERERWSMTPYVVGDLIDPRYPIQDETDLRRLQEASRYILEPLTALRDIHDNPGIDFYLLHGPLINPFLMYDEDQPHYLPSIAPDFLAKVGFPKREIEDGFPDLPISSKTGETLWNQFMAVYGAVTRAIVDSKVPISGVVERGVGRALTSALLATLKADGAFSSAYSKRVHELLSRYQISDDFLFGCLLREGEFITPLPINKNPARRARERWQAVVRRYPTPRSTIIKTEEMRFPFRVEMNEEATQHYEEIASLLFHTARLLPRYAFPVGLDIADKYAKIPDWISRGISSTLAAGILRRALASGDPQLVAQVRQLLSRNPRDFFFRPSN